MTLARLWAFLAVALPVLGVFIANLSSVDLAYHVRAGELFLDSGLIPTTDPFTFTANGGPWLNQQWGAQALFAVVYRLAGWTGLFLLRAVLVGLTFGFLFEACRRRGLDLRRAAWLTIAAFVVSAVALALRPQLIGMTLMALTLLLVADRRAHPRRLWAMPLIVLLWANLHGSFFLGPAVLALAWIEDMDDKVRQPHRLLLIAAVSALASLVNPFGPGVWAYAAGLSTNAFVTSRISEWQPTTLRTIPGILFFSSVALVVVFLARRGRPNAWPTLLWLAAFAAIGIYAIRGVAWWPLAAVVAIAGPLVAAPADASAPVRVRGERSSPMNLVVVGLIAVVCVALLPTWRPIDPKIGVPEGLVGDAPPGITAALRDLAKPGDRIFNPQPWGSWFEFALPDNPVAIDSRIELFPVHIWDDLDRIRAGGAGWQENLAATRVRFVVTTDAEKPFAARLVASGWRDAYHDDLGTILAAP